MWNPSSPINVQHSGPTKLNCSILLEGRIFIFDFTSLIVGSCWPDFQTPAHAPVANYDDNIYSFVFKYFGQRVSMWDRTVFLCELIWIWIIYDVMFVCEIMKWINDPFRRCYCLWTKWTVALFSIYGFLSLQRSNWSIDIAANFPFPHTSDQSQFTGLGKMYREMLCQKSVTLLCPTKRRERLKSSLNTIIIIITTTSIIIIKGGRRRDQREGGLRCWASATNADGSVLLLPHLINSLNTIQQQHLSPIFCIISNTRFPR